jgi:ketosteroid isomerase-like protein
MTSQPAGTPAQRILATSLELLEKGDARGWVDLFAPDGVLEFPYSLPGWPSRFVGHDELWQQMERFPEFLEVRFTEPTFYETGDENFTIAEFSGQGRNIQNGLPFDQDYISLVWTAGDRIVRYRDFWNPLRHADALGGLEAAAAIVAG